MQIPPGTHNWTQVDMVDEHFLVDRMSRDALIFLRFLPEDHWNSDESDEVSNYRALLNSDAAEAVAEIEHEIGIAVTFREADAGRGASGVGLAVEIVEAIALVGGASAFIEKAARLVHRAYRTIARANGTRPCISLGAAEYLAIADLIDRVGSEAHLLGSGDLCSNSFDRAFTGGDAFFVVLATDSDLHHYHVSAYGEVYYIGTSPPIRCHFDSPPPYWASGQD